MRVVGLVLAAGQGRRFGTSIPKVFHPLLGRKMAEYPLRALIGAGIEEIYVVTQRSFAKHLKGISSRLLFQSGPTGTGDAVLSARSVLKDERATLVVVNGDVPLFTSETVRRFLEKHQRTGAFCSFAGAEVEDPSGYGRVLLKKRKFAGLIEEQKLKPEQRNIRLINAGLYAFEAPEIFKWLEKIAVRDEKRERYLTDIFNLALERGRRVTIFTDFDPQEAIGVNTPSHYATVLEIMRARICKRQLEAGVLIEDVATTWIDDNVEIAAGVRLRPFVVLEGPATIGPGCVVGPFAHIRAGTTLNYGTYIGNFVEVKNSVLGKEVRAAHLSYIGDAELGDHTNIGAGTITCNFDGFKKHKTVVGKNAFIGSDTLLIAPIRLGDRVVTGAGSVITKDLPDDSLGVERSRMRIVLNYRRKSRRAFRATQ